MEKRQNAILYIGMLCILAGVIFLLYLNGLLPMGYFIEIANIAVGTMFIVMYRRNKSRVSLMFATFFFANGAMLIADNILATPSFLARIAFVPGVMLLVAYCTMRRSVLSIMGSIFTFWGIFLFSKPMMGIEGYAFSAGALLLFTAAAFILIWILERQSWPAVPVVVFSGLGLYLVVRELNPLLKNMVLQIACVLLILLGVVFVIKSMFKNHLEEE